MNDDIVERLRTRSIATTLTMAAAAEIERLRAMIEQHRADTFGVCRCNICEAGNS